MLTSVTNPLHFYITPFYILLGEKREAKIKYFNCTALYLTTDSEKIHQLSSYFEYIVVLLSPSTVLIHV